MELYYEDAYLKSFTSRVVSLSYLNSYVLITLEKTAFFPGGGGQSFDTGFIYGKNGTAEVVETKLEGNRVVHLCKLKGEIQQGEEVECKINWERRYELMRAHTAQHMFFQCLSRFFEGLHVVKDDIDVGRHALFIKSSQPLDYDRVAEAEKLANRIIQEGRRVMIRWMKKEEAAKADVRIKLDRIKGNEVRVVEIEEFDKSACSGIHIRNTREIELLAVTRVTREGEEYSIEFEFGEKAREFLLEMKKECMKACSALKTHPELLERTAQNLKEENAVMREQLKKLNEELVQGVEFIERGGVRVYSKVFSGADNKKLMEKAGELIKEENALVILGNKNERGFLLIAKNPEMRIDLKKLAEKAFSIIEGRWGGKEYFVSGGGKAEKVDEAVKFLVECRWLDG
ncbi:MAG: alanine--tRNA ligase-related protein [Candidatus Micrarchaeia archaeon]